MKKLIVVLMLAFSGSALVTSANAGIDVDVFLGPPVVYAPPVVVAPAPVYVEPNYYPYQESGPYGYWNGGYYEGRHWDRGNYYRDHEYMREYHKKHGYGEGRGHERHGRD